MVFLTEKQFLGKGSERACYLDPRDDKKVIKVIHVSKSTNRQNELDFIYMNDLLKKNCDISSIAKCHGYVDTIIGKGLIFDRILDFDLTPSKSFRYYIAMKLISIDEQKKLLIALKKYLEKNEILFVDTCLTNVFCQKVSPNQFKLIIIDGLGAKRMGLKFWLYRNFSLYVKYKMKRQWSKLMKIYNDDVIRTEIGKRPITRV